MAEATNTILENGAGKFGVDIEGCPVASENVESVTVEDLVIDVRETTSGAQWDYRTFDPGDAHYGNVTITSRMGKDSKELYQWYQDCRVGKGIRKSISVILKKRDGSESRRFNLLQCFPVAYNTSDYSPASNTALEKITCKMGYVEMG